MIPVYQTKRDESQGNCFAACVASILERRIEDVDVDRSGCENLSQLLPQVEEKAHCTIYYANHEAIEDGILKTSERFCFVEVCACVCGSPHDERSTWHAVVCEIGDDGKISMLFNPHPRDQRKKSLDQFPAVRKVFFVKPN